MMTVAVLAASLAGCALPPLEGRHVSTSLDPEKARATTLGQTITPVVSAHPEQTGNRIIHQPLDAFATWARLAREAERTLDMQYYIWSADISGTWMFGELLDAAERGVRVRLLTNSLESTDMPPVHAGYVRYRKALVKGGVELYEMHPLPGEPPESIDLSLFGHSGTSLHTTAVIVDERQAFLGSYNVDPRSVNLITELGLVIESPDLARRIGRAFDESVPATAYEVRIEDDKLYWLERTVDGETIRHDEEPGAGIIKRGAVLLFSLMPIEWLL